MRTHQNCGSLILLGLSFILVCSFHLGCSIKTSDVRWSPMEMSDFEPHLSSLQTRYDLTDTLKSTKMMVRIEEADSKSEELRELLWYKRAVDGGELLRINVLGAFNDTKALAIANREQFLLTILDSQETFIGELSDGVLRKIFGADLRVSDVLSAIFANPFLVGKNKTLKIEKNGQLLRVTRPGIEDGQIETILLISQDGETVVSEWQIKNENRLLQRALFTEYSEVDGILRAKKVEIVRPLEKTRVVVRMEQVQLNVEIKDSKFDLEPFLSADFEIHNISDDEKTDISE